MNEFEDIARIRAEQWALRARLDALDRQVERIAAVRGIEPDAARPAGSADPKVEATARVERAAPPAHSEHGEFPEGESIEPQPAASSSLRRAKHDARREFRTPPPIPGARQQAPERPAGPAQVPEARPARASGIEMAVGMVWLVRIGVVMLLLALVFGSHLAYTAWISDLPPAGKVTIWYLLSGLLFGAGAVLERRGEPLRSYARVLTGGGLAAVYYTTFAMHNVDRLRVVDDPLLGGLLLLVCGAGILVYAGVRNSYAVAVIAALLGYFSSASSALEWFALFSNLVLTGIAIALMMRFRWLALGAISLGGTYLSFLFWQTFHSFGGAGTVEGAGVGLAFLSCYWAAFTAAAILPAEDMLGLRQRAGMAVGNGGLFMAAAAAFCWMRHRVGDRALADAFIGVAAVSLAGGISDQLSGENLAVALAGLSASLMIVYRAEPSRVRLLLAVGAAAVSILVVGFNAVRTDPPAALTPGAGVILIHAGLLIFGARLAKDARERSVHSEQADPYAAIILMAGAGLALWFGIVLLVPEAARGAALAAAAAGLCGLGALRAAKVPEAAAIGPLLLAIAAADLAARAFFDLRPPAAAGSPWIALGCGVGIALLLQQAWRRRRDDVIDTTAALTAAAVVAVTAAGVHIGLPDIESWQAAGGFTAVVMTAAAFAFRLWQVGLTAQVLHVVALGIFLFMGRPGESEAILAAAPAALLVLNAAGLRFAAPWIASAAAASTPSPDSARDIVLAIRVLRLGAVAAAAFVLIVFTIRYFPGHASLLIALAAGAVFAVGILLRERSHRIVALVLLAVAIGRVVAVDVWGLPTFERVLSFLGLGLVLVVLGFVYNRFQESLRKIL